MRLGRARPWLAAGLGLVFAAAATPGWSHEQRAQRSVFFESVGARELHVLVGLEIPAGPRATALALPFDVDKNGVLDPSEERYLARQLTERALHGLSLRVDGARRGLSQVRHELKRTSAGRLELMLHGRVELGEAPASVELTNEPTAEPAEVVLLGGERGIRRGFGVALPGGGFRGRLEPAGRIRFELDRR